MKRSRLIEDLAEILDTSFHGLQGKDLAEHILDYLVLYEGLEPPKIPVKKIRPENYPWGGVCTMRCNCEDCNPEYLVNKWEQE